MTQSFVFVIAFAVALWALPIQPAAAVTNVLIDDMWRDTTRTDPTPANNYVENSGFAGTDSDTDGDIESSWYLGTSMGPPQVSTLDVVGTPGGATSPAPINDSPNLLQLKFSDATQSSSGSLTSYLTPESSPIDLAAEGDSLKITWNFSLTNVNTSNSSQNFRIALVDSPSSSRVTTNTSPGDADYRGYAMFMNMGQTLGHGNSFRLERRNVANGNLLSSSSNWTAIGTTGAANGAHGYDADTPYSFTWEITRNASDGLDHVVRMTGGTLDDDGLAEVIFTDTTVTNTDEPTMAPFGSFTYDTFQIRPSGATTTAEIFDFSRFMVEYTTSSEPPVLLGDFDGNNRVDAADYVFWRKNIGTPGEYNQWRMNFGAVAGTAAGALLAAGVIPEPATAILLLAAVGLLDCRRKR